LFLREDDVFRFLVAALGIWLAPALTASAQPLGLGTSPQGTFTYTLGATVSKALADHASIQSRVQPSSGTGAMIPLVNSGEIDIGFCNSLELYESFHGTGTFDKRPNPKLRTVAVLFPLRNGLIVRADSGLKSIKDIKGKRIAYGFTSQEIIKTGVDAMLAIAGLTIKDMQPVLVPNLIRGMDELMAGRVDVATFAVGSAKVSEADAAIGIRYLDLGDDPQGIAAMQKVFGTAYMAQVRPAPNLPYVKEPFYTMLYDYTVFANTDVPADRIKKVVSIIAENKEQMAQGMPQFRAMDVNHMFHNIGVPFHEGAVAYFHEKGIKETQ
jgi:TRAP transporter TAXI family solute receptor